LAYLEDVPLSPPPPKKKTNTGFYMYISWGVIIHVNAYVCIKPNANKYYFFGKNSVRSSITPALSLLLN